MRKGKARRKLGPQCRTKFVNGEENTVVCQIHPQQRPRKLDVDMCAYARVDVT